jgi:CHASE1-domain containing sensor protein
MNSAQKDSSERKIRAEGFPSYRGVPLGDPEVYTAIIYIEPFNRRNQGAFGYDMYSEPVRRTALRSARNRGTFIVSGASAEGIGVHGRIWTASLRTLPPFAYQIQTGKATVALWGGILVSLLLAWISWILQSTRERALALAGRMTAELRESEDPFATMADSTAALLRMTDRFGPCIWVNRGWLEITG